MKTTKNLKMLALLMLGFLALASCQKEKVTGYLDDAIGAESAQFVMPAAGYQITVNEPLIPGAPDESYSSGSIDYSLNGEVVANVAFGVGENGETAQLTVDGRSEDIDLVGRDRPRPRCDRNRCFDFVFPVTLNLASGGTVTVDNEHQLCRLKHACPAEPRTCFELVFPLGVVLHNGRTIRIDNETEFRRLLHKCKEARPGCGGHDDLTKIIVEPLVRAEGCDYIVSGIVKYFKDGQWVATIDFGDGTCDDLAEKTTKDGTTIFSLSDWRK